MAAYLPSDKFRNCVTLRLKDHARHKPVPQRVESAVKLLNSSGSLAIFAAIRRRSLRMISRAGQKMSPALTYIKSTLVPAR
jgi:hypothetical protein